jgi:hypothetical protein
MADAGKGSRKMTIRALSIRSLFSAGGSRLFLFHKRVENYLFVLDAV